eukprot:CAMPEP_0174243574 /NCGR_PEP_ID=MMETSP0417-20130205/32165_1 /TAXON_ID=242541 /ORGANISM="Mayorella sp, Strain BSH-02190019" /LENGTH=489 /DNA_ID=CAMNT_0015323115 /DNA_START=5 /DNA_END=1471 /DNA_ORIENTATION=-
MADFDWTVLDRLLDLFPKPPNTAVVRRSSHSTAASLKQLAQNNPSSVASQPHVAHALINDHVTSVSHDSPLAISAPPTSARGTSRNASSQDSSTSNAKQLTRRYSLRRIERQVTAKFNPGELIKAIRGEVLGDDLNRMQEAILGLDDEDILKEMNNAMAAHFGDVDPGGKPGGPIPSNLRKSQAKSWRSKMSKVSSAAAARARSAKRKGAAKFSFSTYVLDFGLKGADFPLNKTLTQKLSMTCEAGKKLRYRWFPGKKVKTHFWEVSPMDGIIKKPGELEFTVSLTVYSTMELREMLTLDIDGVGRFFFFIKLQSEKSVFGVDPGELELMVDPHNGLEVPKVLVTMRNYLFSNGGLQQEGVFRLAPDESETRTVKQQLSKETFTKTEDVNAIANLLKVWYRELPTPLLNVLPTETFKECEREEDCVEKFKELEEPNRTLLKWLVDLMCDVAALEATNKMNPRNLAIVIAPNLYSTPPGTDPIEGLMASQ